MTNNYNPNPNDPNNLPNRERIGYQQTIGVLAVIIVAIVGILLFSYYMSGPSYVRRTTTTTTTVPTPPATTVTPTPTSTPAQQTTTTRETVIQSNQP